MPRTPTLSDIAKKSKVSVSTVSLVLRNKPGIPTATRGRVLQAAEALGYAPKRQDPTAPRRALAKPATFGVILKSDYGAAPQVHPFYSHVLAGIEETCRRSHINLLYATMPVDENNVPLEMPLLLNEDRVDGLLFLGALVGDAIELPARARRVPIVLVNTRAGSEAYDAVLADNERGAYEAISYLIEQGQRKIGLIGTRLKARSSLLERRTGYQLALRDHGITETYFGDSNLEPSEVVRATQTLLRDQPHLTALFRVNDTVALAVIRAAQEMGRRVPQDLSVVGFDDIDMARAGMPALTTMRVDKIGMGRLAVQVLTDRIQYPESERVTTLIHPRLIVRASVADLNP